MAIEVNRSFDLAEKGRAKCLKTFRDLDPSDMACHFAGKLTREAPMDFDKKTKAAIDSLNAYEALIDDACTKQKRHEAFLLETLGQIQKDDEQLRIVFLQSGFEQYYDLSEVVYSKIQDANQEMSPIFENISEAFDSDLFSKMINYHTAPLNDIKMFENLVFS